MFALCWALIPDIINLLIQPKSLTMGFCQEPLCQPGDHLQVPSAQPRNQPTPEGGGTCAPQVQVPPWARI